MSDPLDLIEQTVNVLREEQNTSQTKECEKIPPSETGEQKGKKKRKAQEPKQTMDCSKSGEQGGEGSEGGKIQPPARPKGRPRKQPQEKPTVPRCGAKTRRGNPCNLPAGHRTPHQGTGKCWLHGGLSPGAPKGNKNALKTGEYETIWFDQLTEEEQAIYDLVKVEKVAQLHEEIRLCTIRERRMLARIHELQQHDFTLVEVEHEVGETGAGSKYLAIKDPESGETIDYKHISPHKDVKRKVLRATLGQIQDIEEALTRVQAQKAKLLELAHKYETGGIEDDGSLDGLVKVMQTAQARMIQQNYQGA